MSAPALVVLAPGSRDRACARTARQILDTTRATRRDLAMELAFFDPDGGGQNDPDLPSVVGRLVSRGHEEVVVIPLTLNEAFGPADGVPSALEEASARHPRLALRAAAALGPEPSLLGVVDERMRDALRTARVRELDGLVLMAAGSTDARATATASRLAHAWGTRHHVPTSLAFASISAPSPGEAVRELRRRGRRHIAVGSLFVTPGTAFSRARELAMEAGAVAVSEPLGAHDEVSRLVLARYSVGALDLVDV